MIRHAALREVVGAYALVAHAGADLAAALGGDGLRLLAGLRLVEPRGEYLHGPVAVFVLAALVLALDHRAGGDVRYADGALRLVDVLAARAGRAEGVYLEVGGVYLELHLVHLGQDGDGDGAGVDAAPGLGLRHALDAVDAGLVLEARICARALDDEADLLDAAELRVVHVGDLGLPALGLGVHGVHAVEARGEERGLLPADAGAYLDDDVLAVVGVAGEHEELYLLVQLVHAGLGGLELLVRQLAHLGVGEQLLCALHVGLALKILAAGIGQGRELLLLLGELGVGLGVGVVLRVGHLPLQLLIFCLYVPEPLEHPHFSFLNLQIIFISYPRAFVNGTPHLRLGRASAAITVQAVTLSMAAWAPAEAMTAPMAAGEVIDASETPNTTMDVAEAVRSGNTSQQMMTSVGTVAPCRRPMTPVIATAAQSGIGTSRNTRNSAAELSSAPR